VQGLPPAEGRSAGDEDDPDRHRPEGIDADYDAEVLALLDSWAPRDGEGEPPLPSRMAQWGRSSLLGAVAMGWALGLREVLETDKGDQIVIEVDADGEPHDLPIRLLLDPDDPSGSLCIVRRDPPPPVV
jgi:hypothetical protein